MKKQMKKISVVVAGVMLGQAVFANTGAFSEGTGVQQGSLPKADGVNPFTEGTGRLRLSPEERSSLLQYADNAYSLIRSALEEASGKDFREANAIYAGVIQKVIAQSFAQKARQELMMRHVLNQALELTVGLPNAGGQSFGGLLHGTVNQELMTVVLEDSMRLAMQLYSDDRVAIQSGSISLLPVMETAIARLTLAQKWNSSIIEQEVSFDFQKMALQHFLNTSINANNLLKKTFAEELIRADDMLNKIESLSGQNQPLSQVLRGVRVLRNETRIIVRDTNSKLSQLSSTFRTRTLKY